MTEKKKTLPLVTGFGICIRIITVRSTGIDARRVRHVLNPTTTTITGHPIHHWLGRPHGHTTTLVLMDRWVHAAHIVRWHGSIHAIHRHSAHANGMNHTIMAPQHMRWCIATTDLLENVHTIATHRILRHSITVSTSHCIICTTLCLTLPPLTLLRLPNCVSDRSTSRTSWVLAFPIVA